MTIINSTAPDIATGGANITLLNSQIGPIFVTQPGDTILAANTTVRATANGVGSFAAALVTIVNGSPTPC